MTTTETAVYPGVFDPITLGHLDIIRRGAALFRRLVVAVHAHPPGKNCLFGPAARLDLVRRSAGEIDGVEAILYDGLTADFVRDQGAAIILRGLRQHSDFAYEYQMALTNRTVSGVETLFVMADERTAYISSHLVREVSALGGDVAHLVPPCVAEALAAQRD